MSSVSHVSPEIYTKFSSTFFARIIFFLIFAPVLGNLMPKPHGWRSTDCRSKGKKQKGNGDLYIGKGVT